MKKIFLASVKILFLLGLTFCLALSSSGEEKKVTFVPKWTPLFAGEDVNAPPVKSVPEDMVLEVCGKGKAVYRVNAVSLQKNMELLRVLYPDGKKYFIMEGIYLVPDHVKRRIRIHFEPYLSLVFLSVLLLIFSGGSFYYYLRKKEFPYREYLPYFSVVFLQWGALLYLIGSTGNTMLIPMDEYGYFRAAKDILRGEFSGPWQYTIGLPILYMPFILIQKAADFPEINQAFSIFTGFVLRPVMLCMIVAIMKKIATGVKGVLAVYLWYILIFFYHYRYFYVGDQADFSSYIMKSFPLIPDFSAISFHEFSMYSPIGYNALSDSPSACLILVSFAMALYMKNSCRNLVFFSLLYAFTCLVRVNFLMFAPLFLYLLYGKYHEKLTSYKKYALYIFIGGVCFLGMFSLQLLTNFHQFGSPFSFPYVLHGYKDIAKGFVFYMVPFGTKFLGITNHLYWVLAASSFFFISGRRQKIIFALWVIPLLFFFTGYPVIHNHATRFILSILPGCLCIFFAGDFWESPGIVRLKLGLAVALGGLLTAPAATSKMENFLPYGGGKGLFTMENSSRILLSVLVFSLLLLLSLVWDWKKAREEKARKNILKAAGFLSLFLTLFYTGNAYMTFGALVLIPAAGLLEGFFCSKKEYGRFLN